MKNKLCFKPDFLMIPIQLYDDERIEPMDRDVYAVVYWYEHLKDGECKAGNNSIACVLNGSSTRAIQNSLTKLEECGYIIRDYKDEAKRNRLRIRTLIAFKYNQVGVRSVGDRQQKVKENECSVGDRASAVLVTRVDNKIKKEPIAEASSASWILEDKLREMEKKENSYLDIIATFIREKPVKIDNAKQLSAVIQRYCRVAQKLSGAYTNKQIFDAAEKIRRDNKRRENTGNEVDWTLETVFKMLTK